MNADKKNGEGDGSWGGSFSRRNGLGGSAIGAAGQMHAGDAGRKPGVRNCASASDGRGAGVLRERGLARAEARPDYRQQAMLDKRELGLPSKLPAARDLAREIAAMDVKISGRGRVSYGRSREGEHDDLVIATALACWRAQRKEPAFFGTRSLGLG